MLRFSQRYLLVVMAYWGLASGIYYLCFGSLPSTSTSFLASASSVFSGPVIAFFTAGATVLLILTRRRENLHRLLPALIIALAQIPFFAAVHMIKVCIPQILPFWADPAFARMDRVLHGNQDAFLLYQGILGDLVPAEAIVTAYFPVWLTFAYVYPAIIAVIDPNPARAQLHIKLHLMVWIVLGTVLATAFASAGPVYFARVTGQGDFAYLTDALQSGGAAFAGVIDLQESLWLEHQEGMLGTGISAFPSLHVAAATLPMVWLLDRFGRPGLIGSICPAVIQYGSVITGFHYAVDGYTSVAMVGLCFAALRWRANRIQAA